MTDFAFTAPHYRASEVGLDILKQGGSAIEAMVAAAAAISVVYPHMNGLGGDGFWLIYEPGKEPISIHAAGRSATNISVVDYHANSHMPARGERSALTVAGTVGGWQEALQISGQWQAPMALSDILEPAIQMARQGITISNSLQQASELTAFELGSSDDFSGCFLNNGQSLKAGDVWSNHPLADFLEYLAKVGLDDFYRGETARVIASHLQRSGSPLSLDDLKNYKASIRTPLSVTTDQGRFYNLGLPTQGAASLIIAGLMDRLIVPGMTHAEQVHCIIEATKQAFSIRDQSICDPAFAPDVIDRWLEHSALERLSLAINPTCAAPWPNVAEPGDTVWMGCSDSQGRVVSFIQSLYWEFGSGVVIPELGMVWNNRGASFSLNENSPNYLRPGALPFHTLNPALVQLHDGRVMAYGSMGGEGQPQTQAAILWRYLYQQTSLSDAITAPRWLLGRTWGDATSDLKFERDIPTDVYQQLVNMGHSIKIVDACNELMGHAGALVCRGNQVVDVATDPRSDGAALVSCKND